jgi:phenylacetate-CoA ligase
LAKLLTFARDHVPYYRRVFEDAGLDPTRASLREDLSRVPLLTKDLIRQHRSELIADLMHRGPLFPKSTGGSTGVPLTFYRDRYVQAVSEALDVFVRSWWGIRPWDRTALVWGTDRDLNESTWREKFYEWRYRRRLINAFRMQDTDLLNFCQALLCWRPPYLMGYASALEELARCAQTHGLDGLRFHAIRSAAETLWPGQRQLIENTFHAPVYNFYGSREIGNVAAECPEERRLHLISTWHYLEIVDEQGRPLANGEPGQLVITDLSNFGMPFVRYRNEDTGTLAIARCPCGRPSPVLENLLGRTSDLIRTPQGEIVHGEFFTHLFYGLDNIRQFTVHQTELTKLILKYVPAGTGHNETIQRIASSIRRRLGPEVTVEVEVCDVIERPPNGKHRFTVSDVADDRRCVPGE